MPGLIHPVGPQNPKVYWVRRAILLGAIFTTLVLLWSLFTATDQQPAAATSVMPAPSETVLPAVLPSIEPSAGAVAATPAAITDCTDDQISVVVALNPVEPKVNQDIRLTISLTNTSTVACNRDLGSGANEITIISGPALIWSTDHCNPSTAIDIKTLQPSQKISISATFNGTQTSKGCVKHNKATAGTYWAHARNISKNSDGVRFVISD